MIQPRMTPSVRGPRRRRVVATRARSLAPRGRTTSVEGRRATTLVVSWLLLVPAIYFFVGEESATSAPAAIAALVALIITNLALSRMPATALVKPRNAVAFTGAQMTALFAIWWFNGQGSVEVLTCTAAFLSLAVVGLSLGELAAATLAMVAVYLVLI